MNLVERMCSHSVFVGTDTCQDYILRDNLYLNETSLSCARNTLRTFNKH